MNVRFKDDARLDAFLAALAGLHPDDLHTVDRARRKIHFRQLPPSARVRAASREHGGVWHDDAPHEQATIPEGTH